jgi:cellulose biosynthesis protein BcsQ
MYDGRTNLGQQVADEVRRHFRETFTTVIPRNVRVSEAPSHGLPVGRYAPSSPAAKAYKAFAAEFLAGRVANSPSELRELQPEPVERGRPGGEVHRAGAKA